jgi:hypothetical protein
LAALWSGDLPRRQVAGPAAVKDVSRRGPERRRHSADVLCAQPSRHPALASHYRDYRPVDGWPRVAPATVYRLALHPTQSISQQLVQTDIEAVYERIFAVAVVVVVSNSNRQRRKNPQTSKPATRVLMRSLHASVDCGVIECLRPSGFVYVNSSRQRRGWSLSFVEQRARSLRDRDTRRVFIDFAAQQRSR